MQMMLPMTQIHPAGHVCTPSGNVFSDDFPSLQVNNSLSSNHLQKLSSSLFRTSSIQTPKMRLPSLALFVAAWMLWSSSPDSSQPKDHMQCRLLTRWRVYSCLNSAISWTLCCRELSAKGLFQFWIYHSHSPRLGIFKRLLLRTRISIVTRRKVISKCLLGVRYSRLFQVLQWSFLSAWLRRGALPEECDFERKPCIY